jgi:hypothetical protein
VVPAAVAVPVVDARADAVATLPLREQVALVLVVRKRPRRRAAPVERPQVVARVAFRQAEAADRIASGIAGSRSRPAPPTLFRAATIRTTWKRECCRRCS